jgi:hypothetical protein
VSENLSIENLNRNRSDSISSVSSNNSNISNLSDSSQLSSKSFLEKNINFNNFNDLKNEDKLDFLKQKFYNKALNFNDYLLNYYSDTLLKNTNGDIVEVNKYLDKDLTLLKKNLNETNLSNHGFIRVKPFLINKKVDLVYPNVIPLKGKITEFEINNM